MTFPRRSAPHEALTDPRNAAKTGTFTHRSWHKLAVLEARSKFYAPEAEPGSQEHPMKKLVTVARETSGAINGEFRRDFVELAKAHATPTLGLAVAADGKKGASPEASGDGGKGV